MISAKDYLSEIRIMTFELEEKKKMIQRKQESQTLISGMDYSQDRVQTSPKNALENRVINKIANEEDYETDVINLNREINKRMSQIKQLSSPLYVNILIMRYIKFKRLEQIAVEMNYAHQTIKNAHGQALAEFTERFLKQSTK